MCLVTSAAIILTKASYQIVKTAYRAPDNASRNLWASKIARKKLGQIIRKVTPHQTKLASPKCTRHMNFLENDGTLEAAQRIAGHADSRTTKLYDRRGQKVLLEDMERIRY
jgi:hypothetical protein